MSDKEIIEKIYRKLDGELTPKELPELEKYLADHPESAQLAKEWEIIQKKVENDCAAPLNLDFKQQILDRINPEKYKQAEKAKSLTNHTFWSRFASWSGSAFDIDISTQVKNINLKIYDMKKQVKVVISIVVVLAILILGVSFFFPTAFKGLTSGTFGKAEKYHKQQMTEKDILLRSEFVNDTAQLRSMTEGLIYFSLFTQDLSSSIDTCILLFKAQGLGDQALAAKNLGILVDYSDFIKNNNKTLGNTISMLSGFYLKDTADLSLDVEKNLRDFGAYVSNLDAKDTVLSEALLSMDNFLLTNKTLLDRKTELAELKSIRDQLLIQTIQLAGVLGNKETVGSTLSYALSSQEGLNVVMGKASLEAAKSQEKLQYVENKGGLQVFLATNSLQASVGTDLGGMFQSNQQVGAVGSQDKLNLTGSVVFYDKPSMQFLFGDQSSLQNLFGSQDNLNALKAGSENLQGSQVLAFLGVEKLNVFLSNYGLQNIMQAQSCGNLPASDKLNSIIYSHDNLGFVGATQGLNNMLGFLQSQNLGGFSQTE